MKKARYLSLFAGLALLATPSLSHAQAWDDGLLAYETSQKGAHIGNAMSANDEIFAAMQALEEVEAVMDAKGVDLDALLSAAAYDNQPSHTKPSTHEMVTAPVYAAAPVAAPTPTPIAIDALLAAAPGASPAPSTVAIDALLAAAVNEKPVKSEPTTAKAQAVPSAVNIAAVKPVTVAQPAAIPVSVNTPAAVIAARPQTAQAAAKPETPTTQPQKQIPQAVVQAKPAQDAKAPTPLNIATVQDGQSNTPRPLDLDKAANSLAMAYVAAVYKINGIDLAKASPQKGLPSIAELYQFAFKQEAVYNRSRPAIGDLAFFHNTYDRNRDGRWNDWHSLVGIVESIDQDDTITVLVYRDKKIERIQLNLKYPEVQTGRKKQTLNSQLRADEGAQRGTSSKLFGGFANLLGDAKTITVIDNWNPSL